MGELLRKLRGALGGTIAPASIAVARRAELSAGDEQELLEDGSA